MRKNKKLKFLVIAATMTVYLPVAAYATTTTLQATATFLAALTLTPTAMAFSKIDYTATPAAGDTVTLATNGATVFAGGHLSADPAAAPAAGTVTVNTGSVGQTVNISCTATATMTDGATGVIGITSAEITTGAGVAFGSANACAGLGTTSTTKVLAGSDVFKIGAKIDGATRSGTWAGGSYSTANAGGTPLSVEVLYQ